MFERSALQLLLSSAFLLPIWGATHHHYLTVATMKGYPDGFVRSMIGINGTSPGPAIIVNAGDRIVARVKNIDITDGTAMHWHGILQTLSNNMDGVVDITQSIIKVGETFVYDFVVDGPGTFWYHAHYKTQYMQGSRAALIVLDPLETMYTNRILMLADWYHTSEALLVSTKYLIPASQGVEPAPYSALINGVGQNSSCIAAKTCRYSVTKASAFTAECGIYATYTQLKNAQAQKAKGLAVVPDDYKVTRLKVIQSAGMAAFNFSIDGHSLWVLKLDGQPVVPQKVTDLLINAGQRVDLAVCRNKKTGPASVWVRSEMNQDVFGVGTDTSGALGILTYTDMYTSSVSTKDPVTGSLTGYSAKVIKASATTTLPSGSAINGFQSGKPDPFGLEGGEAGVLSFKADTDALPGYYPPPDATLQIPIVIDFYNNSKGVNVGHFNSISQRSEHNATFVPLLNQLASGQNIYAHGMNIINFTTADVVELVVDNYDTGEHPIHMHGRRMYVIARGAEGSGSFNSSTSETNTVDPIMRDTITVAANSYIVLRFADSNPGLWMMHCHINWHQAAGLAMVFQETEAEPEEEEECIMYCDPKDYVTVGLSCAFVGALFFASLLFVCYRNIRSKPVVDNEEESEGLETALVQTEA